jgi:4-oxalocrotonate tautomerase
MPIVTIQVVREETEPGVGHVTSDQKAALYKGVTDLLQTVIAKAPEATFVVFEEVEQQNWARGGLPLPQCRKQQAQGGR